MPACKTAWPPRNLQLHKVPASPALRQETLAVVWEGGTALSFRGSLWTSVISEVVIAMGASIGRENAPKLLGGARPASWRAGPGCLRRSGGC